MPEKLTPGGGGGGRVQKRERGMESANTTQKINRRNGDGSCSNYTARDNEGVVMDISNYV